MNITLTYFHKAGRALAAMLILCCVLTSCDSVIYDDEGDCSATYRMAFRYDLNMKWADAFAHEVKSVHLYAFNDDGLLVWQKSERGEALSADGYSMTLDLPAGHYRMLAWCGLENDGQRPESFSVPEARVGETRLADLRCSLNRSHASSGAYCREKLYPLFHGMRDVTLPDLSDGGEYTCTMDLTKDTNHIRVILQHLSGKDVDEDDFTFRITAANGLMDYDNSLLPDETVTYHAYDITPGSASLGINDYPELNGVRGRGMSLNNLPAVDIAGQSVDVAGQSRAVTRINVAVADLAIPRLVEGHMVNLHVEAKEDGHTVADIPLTDYAVMLMSGYDEAMSPQEFLDRQDEYSLVLFLDESQTWIGTSIIINSWRLVLNDVKFE